MYSKPKDTNQNHYNEKRFCRVVINAFFIILFSHQCFGQIQLIKNLQAGKSQVMVVYGTSLSAGPGGVAWVNAIKTQLNGKYHDSLTVINSAKSGMWSTWGVQNLEDNVIKKRPNAIMLEFSINDAYLPYKTSPQLARLNLNYMLDRIKLYDPNCQVILQVMNIPINEHADARPNLTQYMEVYREVAKERGLLLIDHYYYWKKILDTGKDVYLQYVPDGIHPDAKSAKDLIAPYILKRLNE